jgi:CrcB protein
MPRAMPPVLLIALGGAAGAVSRHYVGRAAMRWLGPDYPWGTLAVNIAGGLAMGLLIGWLAAGDRTDAQAVRPFAAVGFLGGFTTFSAFSLEMVQMIERKAWSQALGYAGASMVLSVLAVFAGLWLMRRMMT